jgi:cyclopropane-fatty-acyl-phospholipid synthase
MSSRIALEKEGIGVHYDIPPEVFELLLDRHMNYSCAYYITGEEDLDTAQLIKMDRIARLLGLSAADHVLDLGCGWCGPAFYYAAQVGCRVTGITLSPVQREYGMAQARRRGLADRIRIDLVHALEMPYPPETFDHILMLESIIHIPDKDALFRRCQAVLKVGGTVFIQESHYDKASMRETYLGDPGAQVVNASFGLTGHLTSAGEMLLALEEADLIPEHLENISQHYRRTLPQWLDHLYQHRERMEALSKPAFDMLRRYLRIAQGTYMSGHTVCYQILSRKRGKRFPASSGAPGPSVA